ncbi:MAG: ABC transporter permease [Dehalococcoidia bacterium]|nr:ABC transporter permease [Dehalococcoidia bacterium]
MIRRSLTIFERDVVVFRRELVADLITTLAMPLTFLLVFGWGVGSFIDQIDGTTYLNFMIPGLISMTAVQSAFDDASWGLWYHRMIQGTINEYRVNPLTTRDIIVAKLMSGFFKAIFRGLIIGLILAAVAGFRPDPAFALMYVVYLLPGCVIFSCLGSICGTLIDTPETLGRVQAIVIMPLIFLGGAFFPLSTYPSSIEQWVRLLPTTAILDGSRQALLHGYLDPTYIGLILTTAVVAFFVTVEVFDRRMSD